MKKLLDSVEIYLRLGANYESITKSDKFGNFKFTIEDFGEIGNLYELTFIKVGYEDRYMTGEIFNKKLWFKKSIKLIRKEIIEVHATSDKYLELFNLGYNLYILGFIESSGVEDTPNYDKAIEELDTKIEKAINLLKLKRSYPKNSPEEYKDFKEQLSEDKDKKILEIGLSTAALEAIIMAFPKLPNNFQEKGFESFNEAKGELEYNLIQYNFNNSLDLLPVIKKRKSKFIITGEMSKFIAKFKGEIREKYK